MGTGRKTVVVGQVIDPVVWGNPLWDQSVQVFASAADRTAQFPSPKLGAVTYLEDVKRLEINHGAGWVPVAYPVEHNQYSGSATAPNGTATALASWTKDTAGSWGNVVGPSGDTLFVSQGGMFAIHFALRFGAPIAGRAYCEITVDGATAGARSLGGAGDDQTSTSLPNVLLGANQALRFVGWQSSGSAQSLFGSVRITRLNGGKPAGASLLPAPANEDA